MNIQTILNVRKLQLHLFTYPRPQRPHSVPTNRTVCALRGNMNIGVIFQLPVIVKNLARPVRPHARRCCVLAHSAVNMLPRQSEGRHRCETWSPGSAEAHFGSGTRATEFAALDHCLFLAPFGRLSADRIMKRRKGARLLLYEPWVPFASGERKRVARSVTRNAPQIS